ncbi:MAG: hypothetical protein P8I55_09070 [Crocinitomix sp.]|nr:hypothetical protein [Crocinitomicaceae bacterium]MDG1914725.1 hypothetical protein [Crocinitomix sp.]
MKKVIIAVAILFSIGMVSCQKCEECHYDGVDGSEVEIGEICGDDLKNAEENGYTVGDTVVTIHCEAH